MILSLEIEKFKEYITKQVGNRFPDDGVMNFKDPILLKSFYDALDRTDYCFRRISVPGYNKDGNSTLSHLHMDQYSQFLYFFANSIWNREGDEDCCRKLILLNRELSACWISYKAKMPDIWVLVHPVGTVIGYKNVQFGNYLVILQNCTIESVSFYNEKLVLGDYLFMGAGTKILRGGYIGERVSLGAGCVLRKPNIASDSIVYLDTKSGKTIVRHNEKKECFANNYFFDK